MGMLVIGRSLVASFGFCFYLPGLYFGDIHPIIPFLLLGIGVDDMFVVVKAMDNLTDKERQLPIPDKMAMTMKHAGVSITITTLTDAVAFLISSTTVGNWE